MQQRCSEVRPRPNAGEVRGHREKLTHEMPGGLGLEQETEAEARHPELPWGPTCYPQWVPGDLALPCCVHGACASSLPCTSLQ